MLEPDLIPLCVRELCYSTAERTLLNAVSFELRSRGITVIMGHNGAGKSLLLRILHGLLAPERGSIHWNGQPAGDVATRRRQSMVFQKPVLLRRSVAANIDYVLHLRNAFDASLRDQILDGADLLNRAAQPAHSLSGGEQQRLCLARALATRPKVLLLDEPCANLDPGSTAVIEQILRASSQAIKIILVTHDIHQARRLAADILFLDNGRVAEHSDRNVFFTRPSSDAAQAYLSGVLTPHDTG